ncbi:hypothetical protein TMEN_5883 [Trichophyton mentagrophytes]|uniref:Uncharacterized protein n=2 Tax=Trichophyton interdigitale TaxID=101480 RepID=A0A9P4YPY9_9EURO|nr:hypothetical protein H101_07266 [Trichophyton interdigitale H6]KAF3900968.1 hypothetical protein GY632_0338 [Trichophyton interdigitale]KDB23284.1 hypothetical protein H109_04805 [Trichophyton interdigitale MR816]GBF63261.1 hypothetical protein TMEN_5883 [Trichophyton mentagrophytes]KAG5209797.1 hypothetical protein GY631_5443 [Trichophyton interdigitale]
MQFSKIVALALAIIPASFAAPVDKQPLATIYKLANFEGYMQAVVSPGGCSYMIPDHNNPIGSLKVAAGTTCQFYRSRACGGDPISEATSDREDLVKEGITAYAVICS